MKELYRDDARSYDVDKHWYHQLKCGQTLMETALIPGQRQSAIDNSTIHKVEADILEDRFINIQRLVQ